jgi:L-ascorbate metabolism protein UlaG (beta-lactamase superfamily)
MKISIIGHSTVLIELQSLKILTDPYFETDGDFMHERISPPAIAKESLVDINMVLLSHNHRDHVDRELFRILPSSIPIFTSSLATYITKRQGAKNVLGLRIWESRVFGGLKLTAVPAIHDAIATGFIVESSDEQLYFSGDTYYHPFMKEIGRKWKLDVALMPVTNTGLPLIMSQRGAIRAVKVLMPKVVIPIHMGLRLRLAFLRTHNSVEGFGVALQKEKLETRMVALKEGDVWDSKL